MSDTKDIRLSDYAKSAGVMGESLYEPLSTLIFMENYDNLILSNIPMKTDYDKDNFEIIDFAEIAQKIDAVSTTFFRPFLITGNSGCGKRTLEKYFRWKFYDYFCSLLEQDSGLEETEKNENINNLICYYEINAYDFPVYSNEKCCEMINSVFNQIKDVCTKNISKIKYISFGDVTDILKSKKISKVFTRCLKMLMNIPQNICIITCVYDGEASRLKEEIKSPFIIENLALPDREMRNNFFASFVSNHENFDFEIGDDEAQKEEFIEKLCDITEEFNFKMLNRLTEYVSMVLKGQEIGCISYEENEVKNEKYQEFIGIIENKDGEKGYIGFSEIKEIAEKIRKNTYIPPVKNAIPLMVNAPAKTEISENEKNKSETDIDEKNIKGANTIAELDSRDYKKHEKVIGLGKDIIEQKEENEPNEQLESALKLLEKNKMKEQENALNTTEKETEENMNTEISEHQKVQL